MDLESAIELCLGLPEVEESTPFGPEVLVFKVAGKMFALTDPDDFPPCMNLKCDPAEAVRLRSEYESVKPGYHMNKRHWNTVEFSDGIPSDLMRGMILGSYRLVVSGLKKADRVRVMEKFDSRK